MIKVSLLADVFVGANFAYERLIFTLLLVWATLAGQLPMWLTGVMLCVYSTFYLLSVCAASLADNNERRR